MRMPEITNYLTARRAYIFRPDDVRLTFLSTEPVRKQIADELTFDNMAIGTPMATFGPVPRTIPPGLVFDVGACVGPGAAIIPIRFLHVESGRIVIDVPGTSNDIDTVFTRLRDIVGRNRDSDDHPLIGEPIRVMNYSEIAARLAFPPEALLPAGMVEVFRQFGSSLGAGGNVHPFATLLVRTFPPNVPSEGTARNDTQTFQLALRKESQPDDRLYFSAAPLDTRTHLEYLAAVERELSKRGE